MVQNHAGGTRDRSATDLQSEGGNVDAGRDLFGSRYRGGAIFGISKQNIGRQTGREVKGGDPRRSSARSGEGSNPETWSER